MYLPPVGDACEFGYKRETEYWRCRQGRHAVAGGRDPGVSCHEKELKAILPERLKMGPPEQIPGLLSNPNISAMVAAQRGEQAPGKACTGACARCEASCARACAKLGLRRCSKKRRAAEEGPTDASR